MPTFSRSFPFLIALLIGAWSGTGCFKDEIVNTDSSFKLRFSTDTLLFDTTFTGIGSATKTVKIFNDSNQPVEISKIKIRGEQGIHFTLNVDGINGTEAQQVRIEANDSIYVFCKVKVDPNQDLSASPFVLMDYLDCTINGNTQAVTLVAWGQNANYITGKDNLGKQSIYTCNFGTINWDDPKPYVIYGSLIIDQCKVILPPGTKIYVHGGLVFPQNGSPFIDGRLFIGEDGQLIVNGTKEKPVLFRGDRLEKEYNDLAGQWGGIIVYSSKYNNTFNYLDLRNANFGIVADSATKVSLNHSIIDNVSLSCLIGNHATITASNCLFSNSAGNNILLTYGGSYSFDYCTVPNATGQTSSISMDNYTCILNELGLCKEGTVQTNKAILRVNNSILSGLDTDEINLTDAYDGKQEAYFQYSFNNSVLRVSDLLKEEYFTQRIKDCYILANNDKLYVNEGKSDFRLDSVSVAKGIAKPIPNIVDDLLGNLRKPDKTDAGCYEYLP
jgi:hypothetical protein